METSKVESLDEAVASLNRLIKLARDCGLTDSAHFLAMAKTQLLIELNGISDAEFRALCDWLEGKGGGRRGSAPERSRRDGYLRAMRRAWLRPQDAPAGGGGRKRASLASRQSMR